jgi:hypothetical protein
MSKRSSTKRDQNSVGFDDWFPAPRNFIGSTACANLSPLATKLLMTLLAQFGRSAFRNGDLTTAWAVMKRYGWRSKDSLASAQKELLAAGVLHLTRQGGRKRPSLWALTPWPVNCDPSKIDPGSQTYVTTWDQGRADLAASPSDERPAKWGGLSRKATRATRSGSATGPPDNTACASLDE